MCRIRWISVISGKDQVNSTQKYPWFRNWAIIKEISAEKSNLLKYICWGAKCCRKTSHHKSEHFPIFQSVFCRFPTSEKNVKKFYELTSLWTFILCSTIFPCKFFTTRKFGSWVSSHKLTRWSKNYFIDQCHAVIS